MAEKKEDKRSSRTKMLDAEYEKNPGVVTGVGRMLSRAGDAVGFTQEEEYKDKTKEDLAKKKRAGGMISSASKRADGCAKRGKTKGRMV
jgi:hypothetical protein